MIDLLNVFIQPFNFSTFQLFMSSEKAQKIIRWTIFATLLLPLGFTSWTLYPSHFGKTVLFQIVVSALLAMGAWHVLFREKKILKPQLVDWLLLGFIAMSLVSAFLGDNLNRSFWGDQTRAQGIFTWIHFAGFYFLLRQFITRREHWWRIVKIVVGVGVISSLLAWFGSYIPVIGYTIPAGRLAGIIGNAIFFANYLTIPLFFSFFGFWYFYEKGIWRWLWIASGLVIFSAFIGSGTRGPLIGLAAGLVVMAVLLIATSRSKRLKIGLVGIFIFCIALVSTGFLFPGARHIFPQPVRYIFAISPHISTAQTRLMAWKIAFDAWKERPILGHGPETFQQSFDRHYNPDFLKFSFAETVWDQPHNYPLEILYSRGLIGLFLYVGIILLAAFALLRAIKAKESRREKIGIIILLGLLAAYATQLLFSFETSNSWQLWFVLLALIMWLKNESAQISLGRVKTIPRNLIMLLMAGAALISVFYNIQLMRSSYYTDLARSAAVLHHADEWAIYAVRAAQFNSPVAWEQAVFLAKDMAELDGNELLTRQIAEQAAPGIVKIFESSLQKYPGTYLYNVWLGQMYTFMGEYIDNAYYQAAESSFVYAWQVNKNRQHVPLLLGKLYFLQGNLEKSIEVLRALVDRNSNFAEPHWFLGLALHRNNQKEEAVKELDAGIKFAVNSTANLLFLIDVFADLGKYEKIIFLYENLISKEPNNAQYYARKAATYAALRDNANALKAIEQAVALDPALEEEARAFIQQNNLLELDNN